MSDVLVHMSMSLDGFVAGPGVDVEHPMGHGGERLHEWIFREPRDPVDAAVAEATFARTGAVLLGRRTYDVGIGPWGRTTPYPVPSFVVTHTAPGEPVDGFSYVTDGLERALDSAREAAGNRDVVVMGADVARQYLRAGLVDELQLQVVPVLLAAGERLLDGVAGAVALERMSVAGSSTVTHLTYRVRRFP